MLILYNIIIRLYGFAIRLASLWNAKARRWIDGRKDLFENLEKKIKTGDKIIWVHCSSAGEFEQGKPVIEKLKHEYTDHKILLSFFSPSGLIAAKNYPGADIITYLPADTKKNAERFIQTAKPELVIFVKYEFWYRHLAAAAYHHIPLLLVSAVFRKEQVFFKWYGKFYRRILFLFRQIFVQDECSFKLLQLNGISHCSISGDTRFDRVKEIAENFAAIPAIELFIQNKKTIVAGSTWPEDEKLLSLLDNNNIKIVIAPHEITKSHIQSIQKLFPGSILYSQIKEAFETETNDILWTTINNETASYLKKNLEDEKVLIIDNVGMLSRLYKYAAIAYVGGGFTSDGIHNILEAAVFGKPVIFGPNYKIYREAKELIKSGGAFSISSAAEFKEKINQLFDLKNQESASEASKKYVEENTGATEKIIQFIQANRLLTR